MLTCWLPGCKRKVQTGEMSCSVVFHLHVPYLQKNPFRHFQYTNDLIS